jgi:large subunit ribosomal protein L29
MPLIRTKEIRGMSTEDRSKRLGELRTELLRLRIMIKAGGTIDNPARVKELRRAIAKMLTIEQEQKLGIRKAGLERKKKK